MTQGHSSVDLTVERALDHVGKYSHQAIILSPKRKQSNTKWTSHFVPLHTMNFKPWHYSWNKNFGHMLSLAKELLRHIMGKRRGWGWKETRKEAWKQETWKEWVNILPAKHQRERSSAESQQWDSSSSSVVIQKWGLNQPSSFLLQAEMGTSRWQFSSQFFDAYLRKRQILSVLRQPCSYMPPLTQGFLVN